MPTHVINDLTSDPTLQFFKAEVILNNTEIKSLPSTPVEVIPQPGAGKVIVPIAAFITLNNNSGVYTNVTNASLVLLISGNYLTSPLVWDVHLGIPYEFFGAYFQIPYSYPGADAFAGVNVSGAYLLANAINAPLVIKDDYVGLPDYQGGHESNTLKVTVYYNILTMA